MSKFKKIVIGLVSLIIIGGGTFFVLKPEADSELEERQISIKQAEISEVESKTHDDFAGFSFNYPGELKIQEVEIDDETVYSSLEIRSLEGGKITLRIADTKIKSLDEWQAAFEEKNVIISIQDAFFSDIEAKTAVYGAPKEIKTVAVEGGIMYELTGLADEGYYEKVHEEILNSFEFESSVFEEEEEIDPVEGEDLKGEEIILIEEVVE